MASEQFSLSWDNFHQNMSSGMNSLLENEDLVDVTLAVEGKYLKAHKMVLSVCSPYFKELFKTNPCKHPIVFMKDVSYVALSDLLQFMYQGEVQVSQENLTTFIKTAEALQIKGLTGDGNGAADDANETTHEERHQPEVPITVPRPKKLPPPPAMSTPAPKRQRLSSSVESPAVHHQEMKVTAKTEPMSSSGVSSGSDQLIQFKMEPYPDTTGGGSSMVDDGQDDTFGEEGLDDSTQIQDDGEEYAMMEGGDEEPQAGTSSETAGEGQEAIHFYPGNKYPILILRQYEFRVDKRSADRTYWRCLHTKTKSKADAKCRKSCNARVTTFGKYLLINNPKHTHEPNKRRGHLKEPLTSQMVNIISRGKVKLTSGFYPPTDDEVETYIKEILEGANLEEITMKNVCQKVDAHFPDFDLGDRKQFIKHTVKSLISK